MDCGPEINAIDLPDPVLPHLEWHARVEKAHGFFQIENDRHKMVPRQRLAVKWRPPSGSFGHNNLMLPFSSVVPIPLEEELHVTARLDIGYDVP